MFGGAAADLFCVAAAELLGDVSAGASSQKEILRLGLPW